MHADLPPGFEGHPGLYMATIFSLLLVNLLALEWLWRLGWSIVERPVPIRHPAAALRFVLVMLLLGAIIRSGPDLFHLMQWPRLNAAEREFWLSVDYRADSVAFVPFSLSWLVAFLGGPMIIYQLEKGPVPIHLLPTRQQLKRPAKIGAAVFAIAFALTYLR